MGVLRGHARLRLRPWWLALRRVRLDGPPRSDCPGGSRSGQGRAIPASRTSASLRLLSADACPWRGGHRRVRRGSCSGGGRVLRNRVGCVHVPRARLRRAVARNRALGARTDRGQRVGRLLRKRQHARRFGAGNTAPRDPRARPGAGGLCRAQPGEHIGHRPAQRCRRRAGSCSRPKRNRVRRRRTTGLPQHQSLARAQGRHRCARHRRRSIRARGRVRSDRGRARQGSAQPGRVGPGLAGNERRSRRAVLRTHLDVPGSARATGTAVGRCACQRHGRVTRAGDRPGPGDGTAPAARCRVQPSSARSHQPHVAAASHATQLGRRDLCGDRTVRRRRDAHRLDHHPSADRSRTASTPP